MWIDRAVIILQHCCRTPDTKINSDGLQGEPGCTVVVVILVLLGQRRTIRTVAAWDLVLEVLADKNSSCFDGKNDVMIARATSWMFAADQRAFFCQFDFTHNLTIRSVQVVRATKRYRCYKRWIGCRAKESGGKDFGLGYDP